MAELADALDLGSSAARRAGSSPVPGTRQFRARQRRVSPFYILQLHSAQPQVVTANPPPAPGGIPKLLHLLQSLKLCRCWLWATTDTGKGPSRANYSSRMQVPAGFVLGQRPQGTFAHLKDSWIGVERGFLPRPQARLCYNKFVVISRRYQWPQPQSRQPFQKSRPKPRRLA